jgi:hypothetical protein
MPVLLGLVVSLLAGCETADQKIPAMATDYCNCFSDLEKSLNSKTKAIMQKAANAADPDLAMKEEVDKLSDEDKKSVSNDVTTIGEMQDETAEAGSCMARLHKKYDKDGTFNANKFYKKLIKELESKTGCSFAATLVRIEMRINEIKQ